MIKKYATNHLIYFKTLLIGMVFMCGIFGLAFTTMAQDPPATSGTDDSGGIVTQPKIIPDGALSNQKLYLPYNSSGESTKDYMENRLLPGIASAIIGITGGLALLFTVVSGIMMLTAYGNTEQFGKARKTLIYSLLGVVIAGLSYAIVRVIASINTDQPVKTTSIVKMIAHSELNDEKNNLYN